MSIGRRRRSSWGGLRQLSNEREKLLRAYSADAINVATLKRKQSWINAEVAQPESQLAIDGEQLAQTKEIIDLALDLADNCSASYARAGSNVRRMCTEPSSRRSVFRTVRSPASRSRSPFASLLGSHRGSMVNPRGLGHRIYVRERAQVMRHLQHLPPNQSLR
jgi:hypothetical protein